LQSNFDACLSFTFRHEGGYCNVPGDSGGPTNYGITIGTLSAFYGRICTVEDVEKLSQEVAKLIYQRDYWNPTACGSLPAGVDLMVFDFGVTAGPTTSVRMLQKLLGCVADGNAGAKTLAAVAAKPTPYLVSQLAAAQQTFYHARPGFSEFGAGWIDRTLARKNIALGMVGATVGQAMM